MTDLLSWEDFLLWLEGRYPRLPSVRRAQITGLVVLRTPGSLVVRVNLDGRTHAVTVPAANWQQFAVGQPVLLTADGPGFALRGRTASSETPVPDELPSGFVPPLFPQRESPQLPQPQHQPALDPLGNFMGLNVLEDSRAGFESGILLDDGTVDLGTVQQIDHAARRFRRFAGDTGRVSTLETVAGRAVVLKVQAEIDAAQHPDPVDGARADPIDVPYQDVRYQSAEDFRENFDRQFIRVIPPLGPLLFAAAGGVSRADQPAPVLYARTATYEEQPARTFAGTALTFPPVVLSDGGELPGQLVGLRVNAAGGSTISGPFKKPDSPTLDFWRYTSYTEEFDVLDNAQILTLNYRYQGIQCYDLFLVSTHLPAGPLTFSAFVGNGSGAPQVVTLGGAAAGVVVEAAEFAPNTFALSYFPTGQGSSGKAPYKEDPDATWYLSAARRPVWVEDNRPPAPVPAMPRPVFTFRSQPSGPQRRSFSIQTTDQTSDTTGPLDLVGARVVVAGTEVPGSWESWTCFQTADGRQTLLLADVAGVLVIPDLDTQAAVRVAWARLLADLRQPASFQAITLGVHPGFHSFPEDRAYLQVDQSGTRHWIAFGPWDAYRDVSAAEWRLAGLSKPRTRAAFRAGQAQQPPARIPLRPVHGLALWDVYAATGGTAS